MAGNGTRADADGGWKDIIEDFTEEFFEFYFPEVHREVDFSREITFLDKELQRLVPESETGGREADNLIQVQLKSGESQWLLVHVEVQGYPDPDFARRMYIYNSRIYDRYNHDVISLAVLADADPKFRPEDFTRGRMGFEMTCRFPTVKLIDYNKDALAASDRTFAVVTRIHLAHLEAGSHPQRRFAARLAMTRQLYRHGFDREKIVRLYRFMGYLMRLPEDLAVKYRKELESIEGELNMPYITDTERLAEKEGLRKGRREGRREGRSEGRNEGLRKGRREGELHGLREAVTDALEVRFGDVPYTVREAVSHVDSEKRLRELHRLAITVSSLNEFRV